MNRQGPLARTLLVVIPLVTLAAACSQRGSEQPRFQQQAREAQQQSALRCERRRATLLPLLAALERSEQQLAAVEADVYVATRPPQALDPEEQRRLAIYDQEIEQERYDTAYAAWQDREREQRALWRREQARRLATAERARHQALLQLRQVEPALVSNDADLRLLPQQRDRLLACSERPR